MLACLSALLAAQDPSARRESLTGTIQIHDAFESKILGRSRRISVYLPPRYAEESRRRYPVLYLHDGQNVFDGKTSFIPNQEWRADEAAEALIGAGLVEPLVMVAVDNAGAARADEYLPTRSRIGNGTAGGQADSYGRFLIEELMPFVNRTYRTQTGPDRTGLAGSSLGGIVTLHLGLTRSDVFGRLGIVSPSLWWENQVMTKRVQELKSRLPLRVWLDMGGAESAQGVAHARALRDALIAKGWRSGRDLAYYEDARAGHNEAAWAIRFPVMLQFLFPQR